MPGSHQRRLVSQSPLCPCTPSTPNSNDKPQAQPPTALFCCCLDGPLGLAMEETCPDHCYPLAFELIALRIKDTGLAAPFSCWADAYCLVTECQPCPSSETFGRADCIMLRSHRYMVRGQRSAVSQPCPSVQERRMARTKMSLKD